MYKYFDDSNNRLSEKEEYTAGVTTVIYTYNNNAANRLLTKEVMIENDPDGNGTPNENPSDTDHELYGKHVVYTYKDEDIDLITPKDQQRVEKIENVTDRSEEHTSELQSH